MYNVIAKGSVVVVQKSASHRQRVTRDDRLGFRVDEESKALIEHAAELERRKVSDFCVKVLTDAARHTIAEHERLNLSERDRAAFFEALVNPPEPGDRLKRAFVDHAHRVAQ